MGRCPVSALSVVVAFMLVAGKATIFQPAALALPLLLLYHLCIPQVPALLAVGLEGCWGLVLCSLLLPITSMVRGPDGLPLDDAVAAVRAILSNAELGGAVYLSILSIAFFNFFGVSGERCFGHCWMTLCTRVF